MQVLPWLNISSPITQEDIANEKEKIMKLNCGDLNWYIANNIHNPYGQIAYDEFKSRCE